MSPSLMPCALLIALSSPANAQRCGGLETRPLQKKSSSLLGGRLQVRALEGSRSSTVNEKEPIDASRIAVESQRKRLTLVARELLQRAGEDFDAKAQARSAADRVEPFNAAGLSGVMLVPQTLTPLDVDGEVLRALTLLVASPDGTVQELVIEVSRAAAKDGAGCSALGKRILATLTPGDRKLELAGGPRLLRELALQLPKDQEMFTLVGPDFEVYTVKQMVPFPQHASLGIYLGHHPQRPSGEGARRVPGRVFGKPVEFFETVREGVVLRQALVEVPGIDRLLAHLFFEADDAAVLGALQKTAETLRVR